MLSKEISPEAIRSDQTLQKLLQEIKIRKSSLRDSRTACLWFQYMDMIDSLKQFIKAERTGNWELHLKIMKDVLPFFAAAGHNLYLKSGRGMCHVHPMSLYCDPHCQLHIVQTVHLTNPNLSPYMKQHLFRTSEFLYMMSRIPYC